MLIVDGHEDLAWNILTFNRDYTLSVADSRRLQAGSALHQKSDDTLLGWPEYQEGQVAVVFATLFVPPARKTEGDWETQYYLDPQQANRLYRAQIDVYQRLEENHTEKFRLIKTLDQLDELLSIWQKSEQSQEKSGNLAGGQDFHGSDGNPVGLVMLMEGAEGVRAPGELEEWWQLGVRLIGPAWAGTRFCGGTHEPGAMTKAGYALLEAMSGFGFTLDISHMDEKAVLQALDFYPGSIVASHANALSLLKGSDSNRHLSDRVIQGLLERDGIIGVLPVNKFLNPEWKRNSPRELVSIQKVVDQIDYICQMAGDAFHVALGSDFDGGFGLQSVPSEIDSIADLQKLIPLLAARGYPVDAIAAIMGGNWLRHLRSSLPKTL
jgi:membrane dipeptidase